MFPFVVSNKCFCCWCGKSFPSFVTFALGWALASQRSITIQFGLGTGDPCYWLARLLLLNGGGLFSQPLIRQPFFCVYQWLVMKQTHRYRRTVGVVEERAWCIVKAASSSQSSLYSHHLPKSFRQHALSLFIKAELGQRGRERGREGGRECATGRERETECKWEKFGGWTAMKYSPPTVIAAVKADT